MGAIRPIFNCAYGTLERMRYDQYNGGTEAKCDNADTATPNCQNDLTDYFHKPSDIKKTTGACCGSYAAYSPGSGLNLWRTKEEHVVDRGRIPFLVPRFVR